MTAAHWNVLLVYLVFTLAATALALIQRRLRPGAAGGSVWTKYPAYLLLNLLFIFIGWTPIGWNLLGMLLALVGGLCALELGRPLWGRAGALPLATAALICAAGWLELGGWAALWLTGLLVSLSLTTFASPIAGLGRRTLALAGSLIYLPICLAAYVWAWKLDSTGFYAVFLYLTVATNDALSQIIGQLLGRRPLAPRISPAKTVEGALGGILCAGMMGVALGPILGWSLVRGAGLGLCLGAAALAGDLIASAWKRGLELKNFSGLLGAQGGVLDRFDGLIFAAPVFYLLMVVLAIPS
jgi:phosphatidate cytidylyltransferase